MWKDSETEIDYLDYKYMVNILSDIICDDNLLPASIGVFGDWGSGKSSLMHMCIKQLESKNKRTKCLVFNGWLFESYSDAKTALLTSILDAIEKDGERLTTKGKNIIKGLYNSIDKLRLAQRVVKYGVAFALAGDAGLFSSIASDSAKNTVNDEMQGLLSSVEKADTVSMKQSIEDALNHKSLRDDIREFQKSFEELINDSKYDRLVIFIDELDRCREDTILDTLEAMKLFMFIGKVAFVIGADERHISYAVKSKFKDIEGIQIDIGKEYLEKLIQYPIHIPRMNIDETETYIALLLASAEIDTNTFIVFKEKIDNNKDCCLLQSPLNNIDVSKICNKDLERQKLKECIVIAKQLSVVLSKGLHGNPRQIKRFLNTLDMRLKMASYKHMKLDRKMLSKLMLLEYIRPAAFKKFVELAVNNELQKELLILENVTEGEKKDILKLNLWVQDEWLSEWLKLEPKIGNEELGKYFYFARTSLDEKISRASMNLSPEAKGVLENLLSESDLNLEKALKIDISVAEAFLILEAMNNIMLKSVQIDKKIMKAFVHFSLVDDSRYVTALQYIKNFPAKIISLSVIPFIVKFAKESNHVQEISEVVKEWGKTNKNLETAFNNSLGNR